MNKYIILQKVLNQIISEGVKHYDVYIEKKEDTSYKPRSLALIHLFLNVKFGLNNFHDRHKYITDGDNDGGIDAYYIDKDNHEIFFIQSKWRNTEKNFQESPISSDDIAKMEVSRILKGYNTYFDEKGNEKNFSAGIIKLENEISSITDFDIYKKRVIIVANKSIKDKTLRKLIGYETDFYNYKDIYNFLFLYLSGILYDPNKIIFSLNVEKDKNYLCEKKINTSIGICKVILCFVSASSIAGELYKYKNAILKYNPRCYLGLSGKVLSEEDDSRYLGVNNEIRRSILMDNNDFAIFNNGITILANSVKPHEDNGKKNIVDIDLLSPQIINGGQTAYTLSKLYKDNKDKFKNKEVLLRIIEVSSADDKFMNNISKAANKQNVVNDDDRKANDVIQKNIQEKIYSQFGYLYERKRGEFFEALENKIITKPLIINKRDVAKSMFAFVGYPSEARNEGYKKIFSDRYSLIFHDSVSIKEILFSYFLLKNIEKRIKKSNNYETKKYGNVLRYGKFAIIYASKEIYNKYKNFTDIDELTISLDNELDKILNKWKAFEDYVIKKRANIKYFGVNKDFDNYYKGNTLKNDISIYFKIKNDNKK